MKIDLVSVTSTAYSFGKPLVGNYDPVNDCDSLLHCFHNIAGFKTRMFGLDGASDLLGSPSSRLFQHCESINGDELVHCLRAYWSPVHQRTASPVLGDSVVFRFRWEAPVLELLGFEQVQRVFASSILDETGLCDDLEPMQHIVMPVQ